MRGRIASLDLFIKEIMDYAKNARQEVSFEKIKVKEELQSVIDDLKYMDGANSITIGRHAVARREPGAGLRRGQHDAHIGRCAGDRD
jgi:hypothetical protein